MRGERAGGRQPGTHGPRDREAGRAAHGPTLRPAGTAPAPTRSHRRAGEQAAPRPQSPAPRTSEPPPQPLPAHRGRPAGRLCNRTGQLAPAPCPVGAARCSRAVREDAAGGGRASAVGIPGLSWGGGSGGGWDGGLLQLSAPAVACCVLCGGGSPLKRARVSESPCPIPSGSRIRLSSSSSRCISRTERMTPVAPGTEVWRGGKGRWTTL